LPKEELLERVWNGTIVTEHSLIGAISDLRQLLDDDPRQPTYIETVHRRGYRFIAAVERNGRGADAVGAGNGLMPVPPAESIEGDRRARHFVQSISARRSIAALLLIVMSLVVGAVGAWLLLGGTDRGGGGIASHLSLTLPEDVPMQLTSIHLNMAISPDGKTVLYQGPTRAGAMYVRRLDQKLARRIPGSEGFRTVTFSPDGNHVAFFAANPEQDQDTPKPPIYRLVKAPLDGGPSMELVTIVGDPGGLSWGLDGTIVYATDAERGLWVLPPDPGASPTLIGHEYGLFYLWPHFLPDGKTIIANAGAWKGKHDKNIVAISLESGEQRVLVAGYGMARFVASGHLVIGRDDRLLAVPFDPESLSVHGSPRLVLDGISSWTGPDTYYFEVSLNGTLLYVSNEFPFGVGEIQLVSRNGDVESLPVRLQRPQVSPDGDQIVGLKAPTHLVRHDLHTYAIGRGTSSTRLTFGRWARAPIWSPAGRDLTFADRRDGNHDLYRMPANGGLPAVLLHDGEHDLVPESWSPDGQVLAFTENHPESGEDIWLLPAGGEAVPFLRTRYMESGASFSPDGRWIAYHSDETGDFEIYLRPVPEDLTNHDASGVGYKVQLSADCGGWPVWSRDGRELYFRSCGEGTESFWAVSVVTDPEVEIGKPEKLFEGAWWRERPGPSYSVTPDGQFLLVDRSAKTRRLEVVLNWSDELKRQVPTGR